MSLINLTEVKKKLVDGFKNKAYETADKVIQSPFMKGNGVMDDYGPTYREQVQYRKENPFFKPGNTPSQWFGKVVQDTKKRGLFQGAEDLSNPIIMNPYIEPFVEPIVGAVRSKIYKSGLSKKYPFLKEL